MENTLSSLSVLDRILVSVPRNPWSRSIERVEVGGACQTVVRLGDFDGDHILRAIPQDSETCSVRFENYPHMNGRRNRLGRVVEFFAPHSFVEEWVQAAMQ
jgi:hypothetical protein